MAPQQRTQRSRSVPDVAISGQFLVAASRQISMAASNTDPGAGWRVLASPLGRPVLETSTRLSAAPGSRSSTRARRIVSSVLGRPSATTRPAAPAGVHGARRDRAGRNTFRHTCGLPGFLGVAGILFGCVATVASCEDEAGRRAQSATRQRGSNENMNGLLRDHFANGTDLGMHPPEHLLAVSHPPRHVLGDRAPAELFAVLLASESPPVLRR
jgi:hypothetical protein